MIRASVSADHDLEAAPGRWRRFHETVAPRDDRERGDGMRAGILTALALACAAAAAPRPAAAQGSLNLYCSVQIEWCQAIATAVRSATPASAWR